MLAAIDLDGEPAFCAVEIQEISPDRVLAPELDAFDLLGA
jgi:hypothetical protein